MQFASNVEPQKKNIHPSIFYVHFFTQLGSQVGLQRISAGAWTCFQFNQGLNGETHNHLHIQLHNECARATLTDMTQNDLIFLCSGVTHLVTATSSPQQMIQKIMSTVFLAF